MIRISELPTAMTPKAEKLNKLVDAIPGVCSGGRDGIRALVAELSGETLVEAPKAEHKIGDHFTYGGKTFLLAVASDNETEKRVVAINIATGSRRSPLSGTVVDSYVALTDEQVRNILRVSAYTFANSVTKIHKSELGTGNVGPVRRPRWRSF